MRAMHRTVFFCVNIAVFFLLTGFAAADSLYVDENGNVGIGSSSPNRNLDVEGATPYIRLTDTKSGVWDNGDRFAGIDFYTSDTSSVWPGLNAFIRAVHRRNGGSGHTNPDAGLDFGVSRPSELPTTAMSIEVGGDVGIGKTNPSYKLDVNGTIRCASLIQTSDARFKEDVEPIANALDRVTQLRGVNFHWKNQSSGQGTQMGVIGQEVEKVFPEVVSTDPEGNKSVAYAHLVAPLIEAVKELKDENERLKKKNEVLNQRISAIELTVGKLK